MREVNARSADTGAALLQLANGDVAVGAHLAAQFCQVEALPVAHVHVGQLE